MFKDRANSLLSRLPLSTPFAMAIKHTTHPLIVLIVGTDIERGLFFSGEMCYTWVGILTNKSGLEVHPLWRI